MGELQYLLHYSVHVVNFLEIFVECNHPLAWGLDGAEGAAGCPGG